MLDIMNQPAGMSDGKGSKYSKFIPERPGSKFATVVTATRDSVLRKSLLVVAAVVKRPGKSNFCSFTVQGVSMVEGRATGEKGESWRIDLRWMARFEFGC